MSKNETTLVSYKIAIRKRNIEVGYIFIKTNTFIRK